MDMTMGLEKTSEHYQTELGHHIDGLNRLRALNDISVTMRGRHNLVYSPEAMEKVLDAAGSSIKLGLDLHQLNEHYVKCLNVAVKALADAVNELNALRAGSEGLQAINDEYGEGL